MKIKEFKQWAKGNGFLLVIDENEERELPGNDTVRTGNRVAVFVSKTGIITSMVSDPTGMIITATNDIASMTAEY